MTRIVLMLAAVLSLGLSGCSSDESQGCVDLTTEGSVFTITISGRAFEPDCLTVDGSQTARIVNEDSVLHSLTIDGTEVDRGFEGGETFTGPGPFSGVIEPGTYDFYCKFHEEMTGTMTVT